MREFTDRDGSRWVASLAAEDGGDYKGRFYLTMRRADSAGGEAEAALADVRWNSRKTAERTLATMSTVELRRRLRSAVGRSGAAAPV